MVIDWRQQIDECIKYTKVIPTFHASAIEKRYQETLIVKRLLSMGYEAKEILNWFMIAEDECDKTLLDIADLMDLSAKKRWPRIHDFRIYITQDEVEHIRALKTSKENKSFLMATIAYVKMMKIKKTKATFNVRERSYIYYLATGEDNYNTGTQRGRYIQSFIHELAKSNEVKLVSYISHIKVRTYRPGGARKDVHNILLNASWINWTATEGYEMTNLETQMKDFCDRAFENDIHVCENCGQKYLVTPTMRRQVNYCDNCYSTYRHHGTVAKKEMSTCIMCSKQFLRSMGSKRKACVCDDCYPEFRKRQEKERLARLYQAKKSKK